MPDKDEHVADRKRRHHKSRERARSPFEEDDIPRRKSKRSRNREEATDESPPPSNGGTGGEASLSVEETNALRAKLGLPPLEIDSNTGDSGTVDNQSENYVHAPAKDLRKLREEEALKQKFALHKEKRSLYDKLASSTLYEPSEKELSAMSWVEKIREKERIKKQAQARAQLLTEMEEQLNAELPNVTPQTSYQSSDLTGLKVEHKIDRFREGQTIILTLKDKGVLEGDEDPDVLVNVNIVDEEKADRNRENLRKTAGLAGIEDEEDEDVLLGLRKKGVLSKYDADISGPKTSEFILGSEGTYIPQDERMLEQLHAELRAGKQALPDTELRMASEYYTPDEMQAKFKKRTRRVKTRARSALTADDLISTDQQVLDTSDLGKRSAHRTDTENAMHADGQPGPIDLLDALSASTSYEVNPLESIDNQLIEEDELRGEIEKTISRVAKAKSTVYLRPEDVAAQLLTRKREEGESTESTSRPSKPEGRGGVVFDSTAEFYKSIGAGLQETIRQNARLTQIKPEYSDEEEDVKPPLVSVDWGMGKKDEDNMSVSDEHDFMDEEKPSRWHTVGDGQLHRTRASGRADVAEPSGEGTSTNTQLGGVLDDEPSLDSGVFSALRLAEKKGYIEKGQEKRAGTGTMVNLMAKHFVQEDVRYDDIDAKFAKRDRYSGPLTDFKEIKHYKPDVKLEYVDELGRQLNAKEAFRQLSHKFHGKGSGKNKTEKRMKKIKEEFLLKASTSSDTPLGTAEKLNKKLQSMALPYVILSGKNAAVKNLTK